ASASEVVVLCGDRLASHKREVKLDIEMRLKAMEHDLTLRALAHDLKVRSLQKTGLWLNDRRLVRMPERQNVIRVGRVSEVHCVERVMQLQSVKLRDVGTLMNIQDHIVAILATVNLIVDQEQRDLRVQWEENLQARCLVAENASRSDVSIVRVAKHNGRIPED